MINGQLYSLELLETEVSNIVLKVECKTENINNLVKEKENPMIP
jgi:hypothetical protein